MQPRASDISTNPPSLSPVTRVAHKKNTFPRAWMFSFPHYWEVSNLFLDTPEPFSWSSAHRSQLARSALPTAINSSLPMEPFPSAFPGHSACPQCGWSLQTLTAPRPSPKKGHILYSGLPARAGAWHGSQLVKCCYPEPWARLSSLTPWDGSQPPFWHSSFAEEWLGKGSWWHPGSVTVPSDRTVAHGE